MTLSGLLPPNAVKVLAGPSSKKRLLHDIADMAASVYKLPSRAVLDAVIEREGLGPTGVGHGVALPHARIPALDRVVGLFVMLERPIEYESVDRQPVDIAFSLLAPLEAGVLHLKALALVSRTLRNPDLCAKLRANPDPAKLHAILTEAQADKAA
ncbi:PTS sugar transporter subunit IIA [Chachezhania sediminis]|uniref:PTS sugar transporter subunit IIA n=1 Tax=Chachezhania sediminis TaxID=2599291 RepID=UPI00131C446A|nr:PTS sugar transporter subunit IIA [Chachezhania sediminis]